METMDTNDEIPLEDHRYFRARLDHLETQNPAALLNHLEDETLTHHLRSVFHGLCDANFATLSARVAGQIKVGNTAVIRPARGFEAAAPEPWTSVSDALLVCGIAAALALLWGAWTVRRRDFALKD